MAHCEENMHSCDGEEAPALPQALQLVLEGWGAKQGTKYPNWNMRWFVLERRASLSLTHTDAQTDTHRENETESETESEAVAETRAFFRQSADSHSRIHNYNAQRDKQRLVLSYYENETKRVLKERFAFDAETCWTVCAPRVTRPCFRGKYINAIHLFASGSRGARKLVFVPFWGFAEPSFGLLCQPWVLCFEHARRHAYDQCGESYYSDLARTDEDTLGRSAQDLAAKLEVFKQCFTDDVCFSEHKCNPLRAIKLFVSIVLLGRNGQDDDLLADAALVDEQRNTLAAWQAKFDAKREEIEKRRTISGKLRDMARSPRSGKEEL